MSRLDEFAAFCRQYKGHTLSDLLTMANYKDPAQRASLKTQMRRAMLPDGPYRFLAEQKIVIPGPDDKGDWTEGLDRAASNTLPIVLESNALSELRATDKGRLTTRYREHVEIAQATNLTGRKGLAVNNALVVGISEYERVGDQVEALRVLIAEKDATIGQLRSEVEFLRDLLRALGGGSAVVPSHGSRGSLPEAAE